MGDNSSSNTINEITTLTKSWEEEHLQPNYDPEPTLTRLAEIIEVETENYLKMDPDPFDERHPSRTDPDCKLGQILKLLFRKDNFVSKLLNEYLKENFYSRNNMTNKDINQLNIAACRLVLDLMPGLETSVVFQDMEALIHRLIKWTTNSIEPLQSYATGVLAAAMDIPEIAAKFREENSQLVPLLLQRLKRLKNSSEFSNSAATPARPFAHLSSVESSVYQGDGPIEPDSGFSNEIVQDGEKIEQETASSIAEEIEESPNKRKKSMELNFTNAQGSDSDIHCRKRQRLDNDLSIARRTPNVFSMEFSNSSWWVLETFVIGNVQMFPPTRATRQILILRYLTPIGEYQEFLSHALYENIALDLILTYVNVRVTKESRLAFEALKYLAALLCHKKFSIEFLQRNGLQALLDVPKPSIAATGVSICLYYLGYCEEAMEQVCLMPKDIISRLVSYALWLLECSHDSGRCQAIMFFGLTFQFKLILDEFDAQDGLRKLHNVISTLSILQPERDIDLMNEDQDCASRQIVRHVCVAFRRYLEAHLYLKAQVINRSRSAGGPALPPYKPCKSSPEEIQQNIELLLEHMPFRAHWAPVDQLLKLGDVTLLLKIIAFAYEWNYGGQAEVVRSALEALAIACVMPKVLSLLCEKVDLQEERLTVGFSIVLAAAEGDIVTDSDVEKAALRVLVNSVCAPIHRVSTNSPSKKTRYMSSEELIQKVWDCVRSNSGILVLMQLMNCKTPITDADSIRTLACKGLAGLARCETVRQIMSKLPLFTSGELQNLMRDPILQEKRQEHVAFQKNAIELLERLSGKTKHTSNDWEVSLTNIHRIHKANVVAQTKIQFSDRQLLQLIHQHLVTKGFLDTAFSLVKEAGLANAIMSLSAQHPTKFRYTTNLTPVRPKLFSSPSTVRALPGSSSNEQNNGATPNIGPIRLIKKTPSYSMNNSTPVQMSRLQKQIYNETVIRPLTVPPEEPHDQSRITLDSIITEYLTNQHALCRNPMTTCPPFNLFVPHKCPDPKPKTVPINFAMRHARRQMGYHSRSMDRRFVHSRFCPVQTIRSNTEEGFFTCARFLPGRNSIIVGDYDGDIHIYDKFTGNEEHSFSALDNYIVHMEPNRTGELLLASSSWGAPISALWGLRDFELKLPFNYEDHVEFNKLSQDKVIATKGEVATIYDVNTGTAILKLAPQSSNSYTKNKATFSWNDELVLTDGVLYDVNSGKVINRLDKLNQTQNGVFHPNGLEIISNTEVWDIRTETRTLHLLKTVPVLNQCSITFSPVNSVLYAISTEQEMDDGASSFDSSFKTVDSNDYTSIATIEVKKNIYDLSVNSYGSQIALIENQGVYNSFQESAVRLYEVGRQRDNEDDQDEEEDDEDAMDNSDDDGSDADGHVTIALDGSDENNRNNEEERASNNGRANSRTNSSSSDESSWTSLSGSDDSGDFLLQELL